MTDELLQYWLLLPALVATLPGFWLCHRGRVGAGATLAILGFLIVGMVAAVSIVVGLIMQGAFPAAEMIWGTAGLYCLVVVGMTRRG